MEPWNNSVRIKFNVTREAANRLKQLVEADDNALRNLGILSVQIDNDKAFKLNLASNDKQEIVKKNDTLTKLLEKTSSSTASNSSTNNHQFIVNSKRLDHSNLIQVQQHPVVQPTSSQQQNEIVDRQLAYLNQNQNLNNNLNFNHNLNNKSPNIKLTNSEEHLSINRLPLSNAINQESINSPITTTLNKNVQTFSYINMQQQPTSINQPQQINHQQQINQPQQINHQQQINQQIQINQQLNNKALIRPNNLINLNNNNKMNINQVNPNNQTVVNQNVVQQIHLKYPSTQQQPQINPVVCSVNSSNSSIAGNNNGTNNLIPIKQPFVRNPNIKLNSNQIPINTSINQINHQLNHLDNSKDSLNQSQQTTSLTLNSQLNQTTNSSSSSNVALTSPLLVNLLQSDVNDHYNSSNSNHHSLSNTLNLNQGNNTIKEPPTKKAKTKSKRKPKDKPPDQQNILNNNNNMNPSLGKPTQMNKTTVSKTNEMTINNKTLTTVNPSPSNIQYHQYNSSTITIPTKVTLSSTGNNNLQQPINDTYQTAQFVSSQQTNCSYSTPNQQYANNQPSSSIYQLDTNKHTIAMSSNPSTIVNQIKLTNSDIVAHHHQQQTVVNNNTNNQFIQTTNSHQLIQNENYSSPQIVTQPITTNSNNNNNPPSLINKTSLPLNNQNSSNNYFQKLSSLTKETSSSNLIVQNATIVNSTIVNTTTTPLNTASSFSSNPVLPPHKNSDSFLNLPSPVEQNKTKNLIPINTTITSGDNFRPEPVEQNFNYMINPFTGQIEPINSEDEDEIVDASTSSSSVQSATITNATSTTIVSSSSSLNQTNSNAKNSNNVNTTLSNYLDSNILIVKENHLSDTDSGIGSKSTNDASSQSSTEIISPSELINHHHQTNDVHHQKLTEPTLLNNLVNYNNESMIGESTILKNKLVNDMLNTTQESFINNLGKIPTTTKSDSINQVYIFNNTLDKTKCAIDAGDQIDDFFNTTDLADFQPLTEVSSNLLGNDHFSSLTNNQSDTLNVNDFLTTPDFNEQPAINKLEFDDQDLQSDHSIAGDHNYTNSGDHNYTNLKRPCAYNGTNSNMCSNKIKKVNS